MGLIAVVAGTYAGAIIAHTEGDITAAGAHLVVALAAGLIWWRLRTPGQGRF